MTKENQYLIIFQIEGVYTYVKVPRTSKLSAETFSHVAMLMIWACSTHVHTQMNTYYCYLCSLASSTEACQETKKKSFPIALLQPVKESRAGKQMFFAVKMLWSPLYPSSSEKHFYTDLPESCNILWVTKNS